jgi:hypothetical protein
MVTSTVRTKKALSPSSSPSHTEAVEVKSGKISKIVLSKSGYRLRGQMTPPKNYYWPINHLGQSFRMVHTKDERPPNVPDKLSAKEAYHQGYDWNRSEVGMNQRLYVVNVRKDGRFFVDWVKPGQYMLVIEVSNITSTIHDQVVGAVRHPFILPPIEDPTLKPVFDLGELPINIYPK